MKLKTGLTLLFSLPFILFAQKASISGQLQNAEGENLIYVNIALFNTADSTLAKVETTNEEGQFKMNALKPGNYYLKATYLGLKDFEKSDISLATDEAKVLGVLKFEPASVQLSEARIVAKRSLVEVKPDRTVFNVEGTINSVGTDALALLRKAPAVTVDNNNNISVLGRSGVLVYVDGKRLPLSGEDLSNYLENLPAEQIDRFDIITNPGAKYEAEGNAGIIDIRLKKDKTMGGNGNVNAAYSQGKFHRTNLSGSGNYRNKHMNVFGTAGYNDGAGFMDMTFKNFMNGIVQDEINTHRPEWDNVNFRLGTDFFLHKNHTLGFLVSGAKANNNRNGYNRITLAPEQNPEQIDSILVANSYAQGTRVPFTYNLNYRFANGKNRSLNIDLDYGRFENTNKRQQPNRYFDAGESQVLTEIINAFDTPTDIDIYTAKVDYEDKLGSGVLGIGSKFSQVVSDNTFLVYDVIDGVDVQDDSRSNQFRYDEKVYAGYINYAGSIGKKWNYSAGLRAEQTDAMGDLTAFDTSKQEDPVLLNYLSWFPSAGVTWQLAPKHMLALNYGRRINRPDYNVLNPFNNQLSQLSYEKGNPFLRPEIVNNLELGYTFNYRYNVKFAYSKTTDQITRLIAPDDIDPRAGFITWANLAEQNIISMNISAPIQINKKWNAYFNFSASHLDNQAVYDDGGVVDVQAFTYSIYQQQTINLPWKLTGEISGYFSGPGIWGGVFRYESNWGLDLGLQRRFMNEQLNVKISVSDLFYQTGWNGYSEFNGLVSIGSGRWDSRRGTISLSYQFGNQNIKSRRRKTGMEDEAGRVGGDN
ncbi:MAG: TonB-dependent receptor [Saprospiraceae bacterium]